MMEKFKNSENLFYQIYERSLEGVVIMDKNGRFIDANPCFCSMLGYNLDELKQKSDFYEITPEKWWKWERDEIWGKSLLKEGYTGIYEKEYIRKDGTVFPVELQFYCIFDSRHNPKFLWKIARDITERKKAEEKLKQYKDAMEASSDAIGMATPEGKHWYQNKAFTDLFGGVGDDPPASVFVDEKTGRKVFKTVMAGHEWVGEVEMCGRDGKKLDIFLRAYSIKDEGGKVIGLVGVHTDITDRKQAEQDLLESEDRLKAFYGASFEGIVISEKGKIIDVNERLLEFFGYSFDEMLNLDVENIVAPEDRKMVKEKILSDYEKPYEHRCLSKDGSLVYVEVCGRKIFYKGRECRMTAIYDITERKQAENALRMSEATLKKQKDVLEQKNIALREILEHIEKEKQQIKDDVMANINQIIMPSLKKLKLKKGVHKNVNVIESYMEDLVSAFGRKITEKSVKLTSREIEICSIVKTGLINKEIAGLLNISLETVEKHRRHIRRKLGINNKDINLTTYLKTL